MHGAIRSVMHERPTVRRRGSGGYPELADVANSSGAPAALPPHQHRAAALRDHPSVLVLLHQANSVLKSALRAAFLDQARDRDLRYRSVTEKHADLLTAPGLILVCGDPRSKERYAR
jgi:hypothetical protein